MKKTLLRIIISILPFIWFSTNSNAQIELTIDGTQNFTNFRYLDSDGHKDLNYNGKFLGSYNVGYQILSKSGIVFRNTVGMKNVGATYVYNGSNYDWDLHYIEIQIGIGYYHRFNNYNSYGYYISASPYYAYLTRANQRMYDRNYDIIESNDISVNDVGVHFRTGMIIPLSLKLDMTAGGSYSQGFTNLEPSNSSQSTKNFAVGLNLGLAFKIKSK